MGFKDDQLFSNEEIVLDLRPHWWFFANQAATLLAAVVLGVAALFIGNGIINILAAVLLVVVLLWFLARYLVWTTTAFVVTTDRLISRNGGVQSLGHGDPARAGQHRVLQPELLRAADRLRAIS